MTVYEAIELFESGMINEIYNSCADDVVKDELVCATKEVATTVSDTYESEKK